MKRLLALMFVLVSCGTAGAEIGTVGPVPTTTPATTTTAAEVPVTAPETTAPPPPLEVPVEEPEPRATTTTSPPPLLLPDLPDCPTVPYDGITPPVLDGLTDCGSPVPTMDEILSGEWATRSTG